MLLFAPIRFIGSLFLAGVLLLAPGERGGRERGNHLGSVWAPQIRGAGPPRGGCRVPGGSGRLGSVVSDMSVDVEEAASAM